MWQRPKREGSHVPLLFFRLSSFFRRQDWPQVRHVPRHDPCRARRHPGRVGLQLLALRLPQARLVHRHRILLDRIAQLHRKLRVFPYRIFEGFTLYR